MGPGCEKIGLVALPGADLGGDLPLPGHAGDHAEGQGDELVSVSGHFMPVDIAVNYKCYFLDRFNWQSYNFEKYGLPQETPPPGKLLLYPMEVKHLIMFIQKF